MGQEKRTSQVSLADNGEHEPFEDAAAERGDIEEVERSPFISLWSE